MLAYEDFEKLGFWWDETPEENIKIYGMDFGTDYIVVTDEFGKTPWKGNEFLIVAAYDDSDCCLWGKEFKDFPALKEVCEKYAAGSPELFKAIEEYALPPECIGERKERY